MLLLVFWTIPHIHYKCRSDHFLKSPRKPNTNITTRLFLLLTKQKSHTFYHKPLPCTTVFMLTQHTAQLFNFLFQVSNILYKLLFFERWLKTFNVGNTLSTYNAHLESGVTTLPSTALKEKEYIFSIFTLSEQPNKSVKTKRFTSNSISYWTNHSTFGWWFRSNIHTDICLGVSTFDWWFRSNILTDSWIGFSTLPWKFRGNFHSDSCWFGFSTFNWWCRSYFFSDVMLLYFVLVVLKQPSHRQLAWLVFFTERLLLAFFTRTDAGLASPLLAGCFEAIFSPTTALAFQFWVVVSKQRSHRQLAWLEVFQQFYLRQLTWLVQF